ncbi:transposase [Cupriavidus necator]
MVCHPRGDRWAACRCGFFLRYGGFALLRRRYFDALDVAHRRWPVALLRRLLWSSSPLHAVPCIRTCNWVVYIGRWGPEGVLPYLSRYIGRAAIFNKRLGTRRPEQGTHSQDDVAPDREVMWSFFQGDRSTRTESSRASRNNIQLF